MNSKAIAGFFFSTLVVLGACSSDSGSSSTQNPDGSTTTATQTSTTSHGDTGTVTTTPGDTGTVTTTPPTDSGSATTTPVDSSASDSATTTTSTVTDSAVADTKTGTDTSVADTATSCSNTDKSVLPIDSVGWVASTCNNYGIQGVWYCYADGIGTDPTGLSPTGTPGADCKTTGTIPYSSGTNPGPGMCIKGTTGTGTSAWGAGLGLTLNMATDSSSSPKNAYNASAYVGFAITIAGTTGGDDLRVYFNTGTDDTVEYPYVGIPGVNGTTTTFNVLFKDAQVSDAPTGTLTVNPASIYDVQVRIKDQATATPYNFCITSIKPITAAQMTYPPSGKYGPAFGNHSPEYIEGLGNYVVQNNYFTNGGGGLTVQVSSGGGGANPVGFTAAYNNFTSSIGNTPGAYPSVVYGWQAGHMYGAYQTPKAISAVSGATATWTYTVSGGTYDVGYDIWLAQSNAVASTYNGMVELMIWGTWNGVQPAGSAVKTAQTIAGVPGTWDIWEQGTMTDSAGHSWHYIAYRPTATRTDLSVAIGNFMTNAAGQNFSGLGTGWYVMGVQAGIEIYNGSTGTFTTNSFSLSGI